MNDPWPLLIAALSGQRAHVPPTWPARTVHRLDSYSSVARAAQQTHRSLQQAAPTQLSR